MSKRRGPGRPSFGVVEASKLIRAPEDLIRAMDARAERDGISSSEAWRRAAREWLGQKPDAYERYLTERE